MDDPGTLRHWIRGTKVIGRMKPRIQRRNRIHSEGPDILTYGRTHGVIPTRAFGPNSLQGAALMRSVRLLEHSCLPHP